MNTLEIFTKVKEHLLKQNAKALYVNSEGRTKCAYKAGSLMCAVGCLIADEFYSPELEEKPARGPEVCAAVGLSLGHYITEGQMDLLCKLQCIHDGYNVDDWVGKLDVQEKLVKSGHYD